MNYSGFIIYKLLLARPPKYISVYCVVRCCVVCLSEEDCVHALPVVSHTR